jgi:hypothetical protein
MVRCAECAGVRSHGVLVVLLSPIERLFGFLCRFAAENHWVLQPGDGIVWRETVIAFLNEHVLGQGWERPSIV